MFDARVAQQRCGMRQQHGGGDDLRPSGIEIHQRRCKVDSVGGGQQEALGLSEGARNQIFLETRQAHHFLADPVGLWVQVHDMLPPRLPCAFDNQRSIAYYQ